MDGINRQVWLKSRPTSIPQAEHFGMRDGVIPQPGEGEILVRNVYLSVDPAMRGWAADEHNYWPWVELGNPMRSFAVGQVVESRNANYAEGDHVVGLFGWQDYAAVPASAVMRKVRETGMPLSLSLGVLGFNGLTAYFGLLNVCEPKSGETVLVSTAAGSVGSAVGQIAKIKGCRTIGIAGGPNKTRQCIEEFGYDGAINYKELADEDAAYDAALDAACPQGVDCFFDNTSGRIHDAVMRKINVNARIAICGTASYSSWNPHPLGPRPERRLLVKRSRMQGFGTTDYADRYEDAMIEMAGWVRDGKLRYREHVLEGLESAPGSIQQLYNGENDGKLVIRL